MARCDREDRRCPRFLCRHPRQGVDLGVKLGQFGIGMLGEPAEEGTKENARDEPGRLICLGGGKAEPSAVTESVTGVIDLHDIEEVCAVQSAGVFRPHFFDELL